MINGVLTATAPIMEQSIYLALINKGYLQVEGGVIAREDHHEAGLANAIQSIINELKTTIQRNMAHAVSEGGQMLKGVSHRFMQHTLSAKPGAMAAGMLDALKDVVALFGKGDNPGLAAGFFGSIGFNAKLAFRAFDRPVSMFGSKNR